MYFAYISLCFEYTHIWWSFEADEILRYKKPQPELTHFAACIA